MSVQLKIKVTKEILERSKMCGEDPCKLKSHNCAIALAVRDIFPCASIGSDAIDFGTKNYYMCHDLPMGAQNFIALFDTTSPGDRPHLPEIEFEITIPDQVINNINIEELRPLLLNHPTLELC